MHIEILVEDSSGKRLLDILLPRFLDSRHTYKIHAYNGIGRIPKDLSPKKDPTKRVLLDRLPALLRGYNNVPGVNAVVVVVDADKRDCKGFLTELRDLAVACKADHKTTFRIAIEEIEAWYFGDQSAILKAYPRARKNVLQRYIQDSACGTWECLADALVPGGSAAAKQAGGPHSGQLKHEWAETIGPLMSIENNRSPSFRKFRDGLRRLTQQVASNR